MIRMFVRVFSLCELVRHSLRSLESGSQVYGYNRMLFSEVIDQHKKHMARVYNLQRESPMRIYDTNIKAELPINVILNVSEYVKIKTNLAPRVGSQENKWQQSH